MAVKFNKNNYSKALEICYFCISDEYENSMTYKDFRKQLKTDRENGRLALNGFKVDLRSNVLIDVMEYNK